MPGKRWTEEEIRQVNELAMSGWTNQRIASALNRSAQAVANKKISIRNPEYYRDAKAKGQEKNVKADWEALLIAVMGLTVFAILAVGSLQVAGSGL